VKTVFLKQKRNLKHQDGTIDMDIHHFGKSRVHEVLSEYLRELENPGACHRTVAMLQQYNLDKKEIANSNLSVRMKNILLESLKKRYEVESINNSCLGHNEFLRTLLINVITVGYREEIRKLREQNV
jgi:hypothetical protein